MNAKRNDDVRCPVCLNEWSAAEAKRLAWRNCPYCHTVIAPVKVSEDGYIHVNWQDLRTLAIYAERYSTMFDRKKQGNLDAIAALQNILDNLRGYQPKGAAALIPESPIKLTIQVKNGIAPANLPIEDEKMNLKPNKDGKIPSPFYKHIGPNT